MKGLMIFSNNMEDSEALSTLALLRRAKLDVFTATAEEDLLVKTAYGTSVYADFYLKTIDLTKFDFLVIPGGKYVNEVIRDDIFISDAIKTFDKQDKLIAAICAAPAFLIKEDLLNNLPYTAFPGIEKRLPNSDYRGDKKVVVTDKIITARSAGAVTEFVSEIVTKLKGKDASEALLKEILY